MPTNPRSIIDDTMLSSLCKTGVFGRRVFSSAAVCHATVKKRPARRGHGGGVQVPLTSIGQRKKAFKPVNRSAKESEDDVVDQGVQTRWKAYIDGESDSYGVGTGAGSAGAGSQEEIVRSVLEKLIGFSEYTKVAGLERDVWTLLKRQVVVYDTLVGPPDDDTDSETGVRFEFPRDLREGIVQCREQRDHANLLRLYDYFVQLLVRGPLVREADRREELHRVWTGGESVPEQQEAAATLEGLLDELERAGRLYSAGEAARDPAVALYERRLVRRIERAWYALGGAQGAQGAHGGPAARNLGIFPGGLGRLVRALGGPRHGALFGGAFVDEFCRDLLGSEMGLEYDEAPILLRNVVRCQRLDAGLYGRLKEELTVRLQLAVTPELYAVFVEGALASREYALVEEVLRDYAAEGYVVDRRLAVLLLRYYSAVGDEARLLRTVDVVVHGLRMPLFGDEQRELVEALVRCGLRSVAVDVVKSLEIVRSAHEERMAGEEREAHGAGGEETTADGSVGELADALLDVDVFGGVCGTDTLATVPVLGEDVLRAVLATSGSLAEFEETWALVGEGQLTAELVKVQLLVQERFGRFAGGAGDGDGATALQRTIKRALETLPLAEIDRLVLDAEFVEAFAKVVGVLLETGQLDGERADVAAAYGGLISVAGEESVDASTDADVDTDTDETVDGLRQRLRRGPCAARVRRVLVLSGLAT